jgi:broad specificity phosphatase PhoE
VGEIEAPDGAGLADRSVWLAAVMRGTWGDLDARLLAWREQVLTALGELAAAAPVTVVVTHFVAINVAVGAATSDPRVTCFLPDNCSATVLEAGGGGLRLVQRGAEAPTEVR